MTDNLSTLIVFFVYGLAFFAMGLAIALESRRASAIPLAHGLKFFAAFGLVHSTVEWVDMAVLIQPHLAQDADVTPWRIAKVILLAVSTVCLLLFGVDVLTNTLQKYLWLRWLPAALFVIWLGSFVIPHIVLVPDEATRATGSCLQCHRGQSEKYLLLSGEWVVAADVWARYLLYLPGSILAALAINSQRTLLQAMRVPRITADCRRVTVAFIAIGVAAGLIVPPSPYFPANIINYATFYDLVHVPPQVIRSALAVIVAFFIVRILRVFEIEQRRQLEMANRARFEAQQASLEAQRRAREEIEQWNKQLEGTVQQRTRELEALYAIGTKISAMLDLDRILESVVQYARQLLNAEVATLSLLDGDAGELEVRAATGTRTEAFQRIRMKVGGGVAGRAVATKEPVTVCDYSVDTHITHELDGLVEEEGLTCHLAVPLMVGEKTVGALYVADRGNRAFSEADVHLLARFANQASIAIENARLYLQVQNLAVLEERDRLAREMHDSLAQALGYLSMKASLVNDFLERGETARAGSELRQMERAADDAYADVRESILGLRSTVSPGRGLIPTLTEYLRKYGLQNHIHTELMVGEGARVRFSPAVEVQVVRIIQEALTNVRKHAQATNVWVVFKRDAGQAVVTIADDGRGFDPEDARSRAGDHFGLHTMRERAESVGARLEIHSTPGSGTEVVVRLLENGNGGR